jgi:hypothetical protein
LQQVSTHAVAPGLPGSAAAFQSVLEVYVISDLHTDYAENMKWVQDLTDVVTCSTAVSRTVKDGDFDAEFVGAEKSRDEVKIGSDLYHTQRVLLVAGDVSDCLSTLR